MIKLLNKYLDDLTTYRTVLYYLFGILFLSLILSFFGFLSFSPVDLIFSFLFFSLSAYSVNHVFSQVLKVETNPESQFITASILTLVFDPFRPSTLQKLVFSFLIVAVAMGSKYLLNHKGRHLFNPAALGLVFGATALNYSASWWVGDSKLLALVLIGGLIVLKKVKRVKMASCFLLIYFTGLLFYSLMGSVDPSVVRFAFLNSPMFFFTFVMLTEPFTSPVTLPKQYFYAAFTALCFLTLAITFPGVSYSLELSLLMANLYARGIRRYFTFSSSPTEKGMSITTRFTDPGSSFKRALSNLKIGTMVLADSLSGEFCLPTDPAQDCVFIAGGIGVTPYASMIKFLIDKNDSRPITLLYSARDENDFVFRNLFDEATNRIGLKVVYKTDRIDWKTIQTEVPNYEKSLFYISGPVSMVGDFTKMLKDNGVPLGKIKHDFFPGYN